MKIHIYFFANKHEHEKEKYHNFSAIVFCCYMTRILRTQFKFKKMQSHAICSCLNTKFPSHDLNSIFRREVGYIRQVEYAFMENVS